MTPPMTFAMPMVRDFVPKAVRPWIYILIAFSFQLTGGIYLGSLSDMVGGMSLMREDVMMCMYMTLAGMAIYFPILFRMKFRFTNRTLLLASSLTMVVCNALTMYVTTLPVLWIICFVAGCAKIQGTFECMSNIQLWITPKRNFGVFFPVLHIVILCAMQVSDLLTVHCAYYFGWQLMHWLIIGLMLCVFATVFVITRHCRIMPKVPLWGIDWSGALLWLMFSAQVIYVFNYGEFYDWYHSPVICTVTGTALITLGVAIHRMLHSLHPYYEPAMWRYRFLKPIILLIAIAEAMFATEHTLEEVFYEEGMRYASVTSVMLDFPVIGGILVGIGVMLVWFKTMPHNYYKIIAIGFGGLVLYSGGFYFLLDTNINIEKLCFPLFMRGFSYAVLSATFMLCLEEVMSFKHFFQALSVFNMIHMTIGGVIGAALYTFGLRYYMADNIARYARYVDDVQMTSSHIDIGSWMNGFTENMVMISVKQIYGWVLYACVAVVLLFLLYDRPYVRHTLKLIPGWKEFGRTVSSSLRRLRTQRVSAR